MKEITLQQATEIVASQEASDKTQAIIDAMDRATLLFGRIKDAADNLAKYGAFTTGSDKLLVKQIQDAAREALSATGAQP